MNLLKEDELNKIFNDKTISVVCNGSSLINKDYSKEIDECDVVIRFNHGAMFYQKFPFLGTKFDIFAVNAYDGEDFSSVINFLEKLDPSVRVLSTRPFKGGLNYGLFARKVFLETFSKIDNEVTDIKKEVFIENAVGGYYNYTSGFSTILYLSQFSPKEIRVFGYDAFKNDNDYFFKEKKVKNAGGHNTSIELSLIHKIDKVNIVK
jgi:hypothetical protein